MLGLAHVPIVLDLCVLFWHVESWRTGLSATELAERFCVLVPPHCTGPCLSRSAQSSMRRLSATSGDQKGMSRETRALPEIAWRAVEYVDLVFSHPKICTASHRFGFVSFYAHDSAKAAKEALCHTQIDGRRVEVWSTECVIGTRQLFKNQ